jgi:hypothetical protein
MQGACPSLYLGSSVILSAISGYGSPLLPALISMKLRRPKLYSNRNQCVSLVRVHLVFSCKVQGEYIYSICVYHWCCTMFTLHSLQKLKWTVLYFMHCMIVLYPPPAPVASSSHYILVATSVGRFWNFPMFENVLEYLIASWSEKRWELFCHWLVAHVVMMTGKLRVSAGFPYLSLACRRVGYVCCGMLSHILSTRFQTLKSFNILNLSNYTIVPITLWFPLMWMAWKMHFMSH